MTKISSEAHHRPFRSLDLLRQGGHQFTRFLAREPGSAPDFLDLQAGLDPLEGLAAVGLFAPTLGVIPGKHGKLRRNECLQSTFAFWASAPGSAGVSWIPTSWPTRM
jgi:hypothetical protein